MTGSAPSSSPSIQQRRVSNCQQTREHRKRDTHLVQRTQRKRCQHRGTSVLPWKQGAHLKRGQECDVGLGQLAVEHVGASEGVHRRNWMGDLDVSSQSRDSRQNSWLRYLKRQREQRQHRTSTSAAGKEEGDLPGGRAQLDTCTLSAESRFCTSQVPSPTCRCTILSTAGI